MNDSAVRGLLIRLLREPPDLAPLSDPESWALIREKAAAFGVASSIAFIARRHLGPEERKWCDQTLIRGWNRFTSTLRDLEDVAAILDDAGIQYIPLKGPFLAWRTWQPPFLRRPSTDIDIAVRNKDLKLCCAALNAAGYRLGAPIRESIASCHEVKLLHPSKLPVELHFRLSHGAYGMRTEQFFLRAVETRLPSGRRSWMLDPADELLQLVLHLSSDRFHSLFHLYELRKLWCAAPMNLREDVVRRAVDYHYAGALVLTDIGFRLRWNEPFLPPAAIVPKTWLHWRVNQSLYEALEDWLEPDRRLPVRLRGRWLDFQATDRVRDALRLLLILGRVSGIRVRHKGWEAMPPVSRLSGS